MIKKILIGLVVLIGVFLVIVALQPAAFRVERETVISAPPAVVFDKVNNLRTWQEFSPWAKLDPATKISFEGPESGAGAVFAWAGNAQVGEGRMTITESRPHERVRFRLDFLEPFEGTNDTEFTFTPEGNQTRVTWVMTGKNNFFFKAVGLFLDCDKMIGPQFEEGLANLKALAEPPPKP